MLLRFVDLVLYGHFWIALAAWLLEAGGPFTLLGSQALYFASPFFGGKRMEALAHALEDGDEVRAFANYLREEASA